MVASGRRARNRCTIALLLTLALAGIGRQWWKETARANENRGKIVQSDMGSFVVAKSQNLKQIWPQLRNNKSLAVAQLNAMELESADPVALNRRRLLISLLGQELPTDEVIDAVLVADDHEYSMWKQAFQQVPLRDSLLAKFQPISSSVDVRVPPQVQWLFLACSDYRLLDAVATAADPTVEMFKILASADGEPDELLAKVARELFDIYQVRPREAEFASVFSVLLMSIVSEPRDLVWDELTTFVENGIKSPKRSTALPCQGLLTALQNRNVVIRPVPTSTEWTVDEPVHSHPFTMIQLPKGGMSYERIESVDRTTFKNERYDIHVDGGIWMSREEVPQSLIDVFLAERSDDRKPTNPNREREYAATAIRSRELFEFCNWLSEKGGLAPCYSFVKQGSPQLGNVYPLSNAPNIVWNRDADGYRIPIHSEFQYASASGDVGSYWDAIKGTKFCARLQSKHERLGDRPTWRGFSDAWGFRDLMGNAGEIIIDNDNNLSILMTSSNVDTLWYQPVPNSETEVSIFGFRIVRGPIRVTSH